ncbi:MAG: hypothetical protein SPE43_04060 [Ruminococcus sp.]|nr:hypothetical protein [Oscillospiraceae bacterium]MDY4413533.1 hypothetical protein [Ruminococcus sp.]
MADEFVVDDTKFRSVDLSKIGAFIDKSPDIIKEFEAIKDKFDSINKELLKEWNGEGADEYKFESESILSKIGSLKDVLDEITGGTVKDLRETYSKFDEDMGKFNENPFKEE